MIKKLIGATFVAALLAATPAVTRAETLELKVSNYNPPNHTTQKMLEAWGAELDKRSQGRLKLKIYPASQLGPVQRQLDLVRNGQADIAIGLTGATPGRYPMTELSSLAFVWPSEGSTSAIMSRRLTELAPKYLAKEFEGLHILWIGVTTPNMFFTSRKELNGPDDLKGLKIRFQSEQHAKILRTLGAVPLQVPPGDIADSMSKGVIDGAVFTYEASESYGIGTSTRFVSEPGFATATLVFAMNNAKYEGLPPDLKAIVDDTAGPKAAADFGARLDAAEAHGREAILAQKVTIKQMPAAGLEKMKTMLEPLVKEVAAGLEKSGKPADAFLADYRK